VTWDNNNKDWDYGRPLHRIYSPSYRPDVIRRADESETDWRQRLAHLWASGNSAACGCRNGSFLTERLRRTLPSWVPVCDGRRADTVVEVEGRLGESRETYTDFPVWQWHHWYDWNFDVTPDPGFHGLMSSENDWIMHCEWDNGAMWGAPTADTLFLRPGPMFTREPFILRPDQTADVTPGWQWPMHSQQVWIAGRWIYDCGHPNERTGVTRTELHPCKAIAAARWEAVRFGQRDLIVWDSGQPVSPPRPLGADESHYVPVIRFMFFTSRRGGYINFASITPDAPYEFIVDLPDWAMNPQTVPAVRTTPAVANLSAPTQLIARIDESTFAVYLPGVAYPEPHEKPRIEVVPNPAGGPPRQVRIRISPNLPESYGALVSLGWRDSADGVQSASARRCRVQFGMIHASTASAANVGRKWIISCGVNGRWFQREFASVWGQQFEAPLGQAFEFHLTTRESVEVCTFGAAVHNVGLFMEQDPEDRTYRHPGATLPRNPPMEWQRDIVLAEPDPIRLAWLSRSGGDDEAPWEEDGNRDLGYAAAGHGRAVNNPFAVASARLGAPTRFEVHANEYWIDGEITISMP
jgi:hypothetical protein